MKYNEMNEHELIGRLLLLADGLSTNLTIAFYSQIIGKDLFDKYIRVDGFSKRYLRNRIFNPQKNILVGFCEFYEKIWKELLNSHYQLNIILPDNFKFESANRIDVFEVFEIKDYKYVSE